MSTNIQIATSSHSSLNLRHFIDINSLPKSVLEKILDNASKFLVTNNTPQKFNILANKTVANLFFENSTRTRSSFEIAAKRLGADVINLDIKTSATTKGETLLDTIRNLEAMYTDIFVIRHPNSGAAELIANNVKPQVAVINAGDGQYQHPSQAMLDMFTIKQHKGDFKNLKIAIVGDIKHSRVARSDIAALNILGAKTIRLIAPKTLMPISYPIKTEMYHDLKAGLKDVDVIIMLRLQNERMQAAYLPSLKEFYEHYGLTPKTLSFAKPDALVMHPGPINRGVEIANEVADNSAILNQVTYGIAVRMAIMAMLKESH